MNHMQRRNAATFARCQARYDAMEPPEYYHDAPPCHICGDDSEADNNEGLPICEECLEKEDAE